MKKLFIYLLPFLALVACRNNEPVVNTPKSIVILNDNNELIFTPDPAGNCRYQVLPEGKKEAIVSAFKDVMHEITKYHR